MYLRARTKEQFDERRKEIIKAMDTLYLTKELNNIYLKDIAELTRISRTAIYSYYENKEEILLDSFYTHFITLDDGLEELTKKDLAKEVIIDEIASLLEQNVIILKIMSSNIEEIERSTTLDNLIVLKTELKRFQTFMRILISKCNNNLVPNDVLYTFLTCMYGYYSIAYPIAVQKEAMIKTNTNINITLKEIITKSLILLLN